MRAAAELDEPGLLRRSAQQVQHLLGRPRSIPYLVVGATFLLLTLGLLMVWSASSIASIQGGGSSLATLTKQGLFAVLGVFALVLISRLPVKVIRGFAVPFLAIVVLLLLLVLIPGIGIEVAGQRNWIGIGGTLRIQPSEFAKLALILWGADVLARRHRPVTDWQQLLMPVLPVGLLLIVLVLAEGDFGNAMILAAILCGLLFVAGAPLRLFAVIGAVGLAGVAFLAWIAPYRVQRFTSFLNPEADRLDGAWQVTQGMYAFGTGGLFGVGLGGSREKWGTLPAAHTDFIFAVLGEELGLIGTLSVLTLFGLLIFAIVRLVQLTSDKYVQFVATGVAVWLMVQVVTNIGATLKLLPITGVTLPLVSYGGSSLIPVLMGIGVILVLAKQVVLGRGAPQRAGRRRMRTGHGPAARDQRGSGSSRTPSRRA
jgi:cell division protein FtsW